MTFTRNMPFPEDFLSVSQGQFLNNNQILVDAVNNDHVTLESGTAVERMKHKIIKCKDQTASLPYATLADEGAIYTKVVSGQDDLYYKHFNDGTEVKLTGGGKSGGNVLFWGVFDATATPNNWTYLFGSEPATVTYISSPALYQFTLSSPLATTNVAFLTIQNNTGTPGTSVGTISRPVNIRVSTITVNGFQFYGESGSAPTVDYRYFVIIG